jgi:hypothetical protein
LNFFFKKFHPKKIPSKKINPKDFMNKSISSNEEEGATMKSKTPVETLGDHQNSCGEF